MKSPNDLFLKLSLTIRQQFSIFGTYQIWQVQRLDLALPDTELYHFLEILSFLGFHSFNFPLIKHLISVTGLLMSFPPLGFSSACIASHVDSTRHSCVDHPETSSNANTCMHSPPPQTPEPNTESTHILLQTTSLPCIVFCNSVITHLLPSSSSLQSNFQILDSISGIFTRPAF